MKNTIQKLKNQKDKNITEREKKRNTKTERPIKYKHYIFQKKKIIKGKQL